MKYLVLLLFIPTLALADSATDRDSGLFLGGGLSMGQDLFNLGDGSTVSKFLTQGYALEGGLTTQFSGRFGMQFSAEYGSNTGNNTYASQSTMETGTLKFLSAKGAWFYGPVTFGGGYRHNEVMIKSVSALPTSYLETTYMGLTTLGFVNYTLDVKKRFRTTLEVQFIEGKLKGILDTSGSVKFSETAATLRIFFLFD